MTSRARQAGFSALLVLAAMVGVGSLLVFAVTLTSTLHSGIAQEIAAARAAQAAEAGLEWARLRIRNGAAASCAAGTHLSLAFSTGAMPVTVNCPLAGTYTEAAATVRIYRLTATACRPAAAGACPNAAGSGDYVEAQASGMAER